MQLALPIMMTSFPCSMAVSDMRRLLSLSLESGVTTPPSDGFLASLIVTYELSNEKRCLMSALAAVGYVLALASITFFVRFRREKTVKAAGIDYILIILIGCSLGYTSIAIELLPHSTMQCNLRMWLYLLSYATIMGSLLMKNLHIWLIFRAQEILNTDVLGRRCHLANQILISTDMILFWWFVSTMKLESTLTFINAKFAVRLCTLTARQSGLSVAAIVFYAYNAILLASFLPTLYMTRKVFSTYSDATLLSLTFVSMIFLIVAFTSLEGNFDKDIELKMCICVFSMITIVIFLIAGPRMWNLWLHYRDKQEPLISFLKQGSKVRTSMARRPTVYLPMRGSIGARKKSSISTGQRKKSIMSIGERKKSMLSVGRGENLFAPSKCFRK
ncbi:7 transmembrane sweet-taste receptor of 3 GCPR-domain-containing protein [Chytriomyces sp. MP71]|nr:7 transmembrane sweet-taste receptor of 3 GCPR-domain-containing protein [Chytriomyces sp. MP71]